MLALATVATIPASASAVAGDFFQPVTSPESAGDASRGIASADFDDDGNADLAIGNGEDTNTVTLLKGNGAGDFAPFASSPLAMGASLAAWEVVAADVDNDGDQDIVVADTGMATLSDIGIFLNDGSANFAAPLVESLGAANQPRELAVGHLNADSYIDIAVGNFGPTASVSILLNLGDTDMVPDGIGNGDFSVGAPIVVNTPNTNLTGIAAAPFDNDGDVDLMISREFSNDMVFLSNTGSGTFAVGTPQSPGADTHPGRIAVGNFNGGFPDLAVGVSPSGVAILNGAGDGSFTHMAGSPVSIGSSPSGSTPNALVAEELSGDSAVDVAVAIGFNTGASRIAILLGNGAGAFSAAPTSPELAPSPTIGPNVPLGITAGQFNGGNLDLANSNLFPQPSTPVNIWLNDATTSGGGGGGGGGGGDDTTPPKSKKCKKGFVKKKGKCKKKKRKKKRKK